MTRDHEQPETRIRWEGDSNKKIRSWPDPVKENIGGDLERLEHGEDPLDSKPMSGLRGVSELRDEHFNVLYRLMYFLHAGWIYVLHCFTKTTPKTSKQDLKLTNKRLTAVKARKDKPYKTQPAEVEEEEKSA
jgi:phage-related protein